mmetsp:Transcript_5219/g.8953  ORF Transcript_5219/g.8953 Transcript_5219/m.8953 type:complete len:304 (-) Transcript_5219:239-1150(-)
MLCLNDLDLIVKFNPAFLEKVPGNDPLCHVQLGLLVLGIVAQVNGFGCGFGGVAAPGLTPQPLLGEGVDGDRVLRVVGQVLVQVGQRVRVAAQRVVHPAQLVADHVPAEGAEVHDVQRGDVVRPPAQVIRPEPAPPELVAERLLPGVAEGGVPVRLPPQVQLPQLPQVRPHHLVRVHVDHLLDAEGEQHVQEEDLVAPDDALLLGLLAEPLRPLVSHVAHLEACLLRHCSGTVFESGGQEILKKPKLDLHGAALDHAQHHDLEHPLVQVARGQGEHVDRVVVVVVVRALVAEPLGVFRRVLLQ